MSRQHRQRLARLMHEGRGASRSGKSHAGFAAAWLNQDGDRLGEVFQAVRPRMTCRVELITWKIFTGRKGIALSAEFVAQITRRERRLHAFILSIVWNPAEADDVLQETKPFEHVDHHGWPRKAEPVLDLEAMKNLKDKNNKIYRDVPLDTTGFIECSGDPKLDGPVREAPEMLRRLAESDRVRHVFIRHAFRFFLGRNVTPDDAATLQEADLAYIESGDSFKALVVSLLSSESFLFRTVPTKGAVK